MFAENSFWVGTIPAKDGKGLTLKVYTDPSEILGRFVISPYDPIVVRVHLDGALTSNPFAESPPAGDDSASWSSNTDDPNWVVKPTNALKFVGEDHKFKARITDHDPNTLYQWRKNNSLVAEGPLYELQNLQLGDSGEYRVVAIDDSGVFGADAELKVVPPFIGVPSIQVPFFWGFENRATRRQKEQTLADKLNKPVSRVEKGIFDFKGKSLDNPFIFAVRIF